MWKSGISCGNPVRNWKTCLLWVQRSSAEGPSMRRQLSPHLDDLRVVLAVAEERSFRRASIRVGLSQSGVTRVVARVERHAGARLFERSNNRYQSVLPTEPGCEYIERIRSAIAQTDNAVISAREAKNGMVHRIVVGRSMYTDKRLPEPTINTKSLEGLTASENRA